jgi:hypothetical protein
MLETTNLIFSLNIFILNTDPKIAAELHCDKHCVKMILEYAQLLSTAHHVLSDNPPNEIYKKTHTNHPCAIWARESLSNYKWLNELFSNLLDEYTKRYNKIHATSRLKKILSQPPKELKDIGATPFAQAMPDYCKHKDPVIAYQQYYLNEKYEIAAWKHSNPPSWWI